MDTKRLRQRVLDLAIHGKLVPQNPQDEPASELLKRIAEEKERLIKDGKIKKSKKKANEDIDEVPFEVPQGWVWCRLEDITSQITDGEHKTPKRVKSYCGYYLLSARNVLNGSINLNDVDYVDKEEYDIISRRCNPVLGDILISCSGTVGRIAVIKDNNKYVMVRSAAVAKPLFVISDYLLYTLQSPELQMQIEERSKQTAQANLFQGEIRMLQIPLPPLAEQHRIVSEVEKYFSLIDILEESENGLQQSIQKAKSKILDLAIKGKLVEKTGEWEEKKLGDICNYGKCITVNVEDIAPDSWVLELEDIEKDTARIQNRISRQEREIKGTRKSKKKGDVLYSKLRTYLNKVLVAKEDGFCTTEIIPIKPNECITAEYLCHVMRSKYFVDYTVQCGYGVKMPRLSTTDAKKAIIPLPPLAEQQQIVTKIEELFTQLDNIAEALK